MKKYITPGLILILAGLYFLVDALPGVDLPGSVFFLAVGLALLIARLTTGRYGLSIAGFVVFCLGAGWSAMELLKLPGMYGIVATLLSLALAFLLIHICEYPPHRPLAAAPGADSAGLRRPLLPRAHARDQRDPAPLLRADLPRDPDRAGRLAPRPRRAARPPRAAGCLVPAGLPARVGPPACVRPPARVGPSACVRPPSPRRTPGLCRMPSPRRTRSLFRTRSPVSEFSAAAAEPDASSLTPEQEAEFVLAQSDAAASAPAEDPAVTPEEPTERKDTL